jgi:hypothetical protein
MDSFAAAVEKIEKASISGAEKYANSFSRMPSPRERYRERVAKVEKRWKAR